MKRFWNWLPPEPTENTDPDSDADERVLRINGAIAEESWLDDDVTPAVFASELNAGSGPVTVWLNSPGGDVVAAARIYNMLLDYPGQVRVNIDGIAASAASVIAMAASHVAMSPVSMLMIHNPATLAMGDKTELSRALDMLESVKDSIINAYQLKTGLSRAKLSKLMDAETWMDATAAIVLGSPTRFLQVNEHLIRTKMSRMRKSPARRTQMTPMMRMRAIRSAVSRRSYLKTQAVVWCFPGRPLSSDWSRS